MASHDKNGREYAKLSDLKKGDPIELDDGFTCLFVQQTPVFEQETGLYFPCNHGMHFLKGQDDGDGYCVGVYKL